MITLTLENATFTDFSEKALMTGGRKSGNQNICISCICHTHYGVFMSKERSEPCLHNDCQGKGWLKHVGNWLILCLMFFCKICSHWEWLAYQNQGKEENVSRPPENMERMAKGSCHKVFRLHLEFTGLMMMLIITTVMSTYCMLGSVLSTSHV